MTPKESETFHKSVLSQRDKIDSFTQKLLEDVTESNWRNRVIISESHERILEYFWNVKRKDVREELPISVVYFFESSDSPGDLRSLNESKVNLLLSELETKGYILRKQRKSDNYNLTSQTEQVITLTKQGLKFIWARHPPVLIWWTKLLDATPNSISLLITMIGLVASVFGIVEFIKTMYR